MAVSGLGIASLTWGLWQIWAQRSADNTATHPVAADASLGRVSPGAVSISTEAPDKTADPTESAHCHNCDIVLITMCSLRKDAVGIYGQPAAFTEAGQSRTPAIDSVARRGVRFTRAYAASNFTLAGLTAVLTGRFGSSTAVKPASVKLDAA